MQTDGTLSEPAASSPALNADYPWDEFASADYCDHNYLELRQDDAEILKLTASWFAEAMEGRTGRGVDVGAGPNLYPSLAMLPHCSELTLREYSAANLAFLREQTGKLPERWRPFWDLVAERSGADGFAAARELLAECATVEQGSIFELPRASWDLGTMFFVAESLSEDPAEFEAATACFVRALRPGAPFAAAFMEHSLGYDVAGVSFPATPVGEPEIAACLDPLAADLKVHWVEMRPQLRPGLNGMIVAVGRAR
jgi:hypothetical protein